ncbi:mitochondrial import inner membrane translocase subunit tim21 [Cladophialophora chaetospira]|uniref:Mitochondrial import inner membrane translocase subunit Tim21 n=1 Tax=Cladophialophora chaetospira TaxID=386627 RepID=A0AA38XJ21_9EURO|nr:mitochondrial import inner membrane translocase subunit tim21 [Cladophialophora chaetospira]
MATKARAFQEACRFRRQEQIQPSRAFFPHSHRSGLYSEARRRNPSKSSFLIPLPRQIQSRSASTSSGPSRRAITVTTDDGRYDWKELSTGEKAARGTQQTFNFLLVSLGLVGTVGLSPISFAFVRSLTATQITISYLLYQELLAPSSSTIQFNAAVSRIKASSECRALLGPSSQIIAYGEPTSNKWARARPLAHSTEVDKYGTTHLRMHFNVEGKESGVKGVVTVHMTKPKDADRLEYQLLSLSSKGHETVYLENKAAEKGMKGQAAKMFGVQWR